MCKLCDEGKPQDHSGTTSSSRRDFLKASTATAARTFAPTAVARSSTTRSPWCRSYVGPPGVRGQRRAFAIHAKRRHDRCASCRIRWHTVVHARVAREQAMHLADQFVYVMWLAANVLVAHQRVGPPVKVVVDERKELIKSRRIAGTALSSVSGGHSARSRGSSSWRRRAARSRSTPAPGAARPARSPTVPEAWAS